jgi:hypothetical protein
MVLRVINQVVTELRGRWEGAPFAVEVQRWPQLFQAAARWYSAGASAGSVTSRRSA